jgi:hypothetical protein
MVIFMLSALLSFSAVAFAGGGMDPNGCPAVHAGACSAAGIRIDPNGQPRPTAAASTDQGSMIDPDGKPSR